VARQVANERHAQIVRAGEEPHVDLAAPGRFQRRNFALAAVAAEVYLGRALDRDAIARAARELRVPGRLEKVDDDPVTLYDGAHNPSGAEALAESLPDVLSGRSPRVCVASVLDDKDAAGILRALLPHFDHVVFTRCENPRALSPATLDSLASQLGGPPAESVPLPGPAVQRARAIAGREGAVVATGSIYLIADLVRPRSGTRASTL
jgi:dihydrofolate synthase/folylpolyglutamate synthase